MRKMKIVAMLIATMFVGLTATSISGAVDLNADINVTIDGFLGVVSPIINQAIESQINQTVTFEVDVNEADAEPENHTYIVNDSLVINLNINDQSERSLPLLPFLSPRLVFYRVIIARGILDVLELPRKFGLLDRFFPVRVPLSSVGVVDTLRAVKDTNITIPIKYNIVNETFHGFENLTMHISVMGFLPGDVNGFSLQDAQIPIINKKEVNLEVFYKDDI